MLLRCWLGVGRDVWLVKSYVQANPIPESRQKSSSRLQYQWW